jgi:hypothetical protein
MHETPVEQSPTPELCQRISERLGREPRGLRAVAVTSSAGDPMVIRVASIVDGKPFPTLYWLIDPDLCLRIDREEAGGTIAELQQRIDASAALREAMAEDHRAHIELRERFLDERERQLLRERGFRAALDARGIGGIADFGRIRCLHTWYAAHLVIPNTVGRMLDERWTAAEPGQP